MKKLLRRLRVSTLLILLVEVFAVGGVILAYYFDFLSIRSLFSMTVIVGLSALIMVLNIIFMLTFLALMLRQRETVDLQVSELLGSDIPEAYRYAGLGMIVVDDHQTIIWMNEVIQDLNIPLYEEPILAWQPSLQTLLDNTQEEIELVLGELTYSVKYLAQSKMYLFKDISDYAALMKLYRKEAQVLGVLVLDNYELNAPAFDESSDYISRIRATISQYFMGLGFAIKKIRSDAYYIVGNMLAFEKIKADQFKILSTIFDLERGSNKRITISLGLAYGTGADIDRLDKTAFAAVELAVARGGNQAIIDDQVKKDSFGGYVLNQEFDARQSFRIRERNSNLIKVMKEAKFIYITSHTETDLDGLGAALGIKAIADIIGVEARIVFDYDLGEKRTVAAATSSFTVKETKKTFISSKLALDEIEKDDLLMVVDTSRPESIVGQALLQKNIPTVVIDHHKRGESFISQVIMDPIIDINAASATELVVDVMLHNEFFTPDTIQITPAIATIMLAGIYLDTNFFKNKAIGPQTFEAARFLNSVGANTSKAHDLLKEDFEEMTVINKMMSKLITLDTGVYLSTLEEEEHNLDPTLLAKTANIVMDLRGVNAVFVLGRTAEKKVKISARSDGTMNVAMILEKLGGGGHHTMAGYETPQEASLDEVKNQLIKTYKEYQSRARGKGEEQ